MKGLTRRLALVVKLIDSRVTTAEMKGRDHYPWQDYKTVGKEILEVINGKAQ